MASGAGLPLPNTCGSGVCRDISICRLQPCALLQGHFSAVTSLALAPDNWTLLSSSRDRTVHLWDLRTHAKIATVPIHEAVEGGSVASASNSFHTGTSPCVDTGECGRLGCISAYNAQQSLLVVSGISRGSAVAFFCRRGRATGRRGLPWRASCRQGCRQARRRSQTPHILCDGRRARHAAHLAVSGACTRLCTVVAQHPAIHIPPIMCSVTAGTCRGTCVNQPIPPAGQTRSGACTSSRQPVTAAPQQAARSHGWRRCRMAAASSQRRATAACSCLSRGWEDEAFS